VNKIPTLFVRDPDNLRWVTTLVHRDCRWVIDGEGVATRKYDGTCVMFDGQRWWARREVKPNKQPPLDFWPVGSDPNTGKTVGWEPAGQSSFRDLLSEAWSAAPGPFTAWSPGTYELCGPKINGNRELLRAHTLIAHSAAERVPGAPRDFDGLRAWLKAHPGWEGLVWHHADGRMAKIKWKDFA